jgi:hypothetical protein
MRYRVLWAPFAEASLERLLRESNGATALAVAAREIDGCLFAAPMAFGESRYDAVRIGFVYPLGVQFEVMEDVRTVVVYDVWRIDRK